MSTNEQVIVLGASNKPDRYSFKAIQMLTEHGHSVVGVHPKLEMVGETRIFPTIRAAAEHSESIDTVTLYLSPARLAPLVPGIIAVKPQRVIMNPGTEDKEIEAQLTEAGITVQEACTLVLLSTGQY